MLWWTLRQLRAKNAGTRREAAAKLGLAGNRAAIQPLAGAAKDPDTPVRVAALHALGRIGDPSVADIIFTAVSDSETGRGAEDASALRAAAASALAELGSGATKALIKAAADRNPRVREVAVQAIAGTTGEDAERVLVASLRDDRSSVRQAAALGLAQGAGSRAVGPLRSALGHKDAQTRRSAALALGSIGGDEAAAALIGAARDREQAVREAAIQQLGRIGSRPAIDALLAVYVSQDREGRHAAAAALKPLDWEPADARERAFHAVVHGNCGAAALEGSVAIEPLLTALADKDAAVRREAARALGGIADAAVGPPLVDALADHDEAVRLAAMQSLRQAGPAAFLVVVEALDARATAVRSAAKAILAGIAEAPGVVRSLTGTLAAHRARAGDEVVRISGPEATGRARLAADSITRVLAHAADRIPETELQTAAGLPDFDLLDDPDDPARSERLSCETLRAHARSELERRGKSAG